MDRTTLPICSADCLVSPKQQEDIMKILADYGPTEDLAFDHYVTDFEFG